jgi:hypothetical protein
VSDFISGLLDNPAVNMGLGILANNRGPGAFGNALQGGLLAAQNAQQMQAMQAMRALQAKKLEAEQAEAERQAQARTQLAQLFPGVPEAALTDAFVGKAMERAYLPPEPPTDARMAQWWLRASPEEKAAYQDQLRLEGALRPRGSSVNVQNVLPPTIKEGYQYAEGPGGRWSAAPVPGGPHDPYAPKPPTEGQRKTGGFLQRMEAVTPEIRETEAAPGMVDYFASGSALSNAAVSENYQKYLKSSREWIAGALRYESGAAVPETEFWRYYQTYFAVPGDKPGTIKAKAEARKRMEDSLRTSAGPIMAPPVVAPGASAADARARLREQGYVD